MSVILIGPGPDAVRDRVGGKAASLNALAGAGLTPPPWRALTPEAFRQSVSEPLRQALESGTPVDPSALRPSPAVMEAVAGALAEIAPDGALLAVRSSGVDEDGAAHSFAGQHDTRLNVAHGDVAEAIAAVWASGYSDRARAYRAEKGLGPPAAPAVILQAMVQPDAAGVAFSADPIDGRGDIAVVSATTGLGDKLVDGAVTGETWRIGADGRVDTFEPGEETALTNAQASRVAALARQAAAHFGAPQDVEWALAGDTLHALQARPITTLALGGTDRILWDNSNIVESYPGVTSPLTFTFAKRAYAGVYKELARVLGVPRRTIAANAATFDAMLGWVDGRIYYNLLNWYRGLALLPGFAVTRGWMETMMGVDQALSPALAAEAAGRATGGPLAKLGAGFGLAGAALGLVRRRFGLNGSVKRFHAHVDATLNASPPLEAAPFDALTAEYRRLEDALLARWTPPLVNDLWCMIAFGAAKKLAAKWAGDGDGDRLNAALADQGDIVSAEPVKRIAAMGAMVEGDGALAQALEGDVETAWAAVGRHRDLNAAVADYLAKFGDRSAGELKLEGDTLHDDATPLFRAIAAAARRGPAPAQDDGDPYAALLEPLAKAPLKRAVLKAVAKEAAARVRDRENLRFERTRVFGRVRALLRAMGERLAAGGRLDDPRDVFFLTLDELMDGPDGQAPADDTAALARARRAAYDRHLASPAPPRRFESVGGLSLGMRVVPPQPPADLTGADRQGLGACPGVVTGRARVVTDPAGVSLEEGDILVAAFTDPGWVTLFAQASALVVERGSLLSHSAIVAREIGLPAVVGVAHATQWIPDGARITVDGAAGTVRRHDLDASVAEAAE